jgi:cGMP-dependent protein kinase 2
VVVEHELGGLKSAANAIHQGRLSITGHFNQYESMSSQKDTDTRGEGVSESSNPQVRNFSYAYLTQRGHYPDQPHKANQDAVLAVLGFGRDEHRHLFAVMDGHGETGAECAYFCRAKFPLLLAQQTTLDNEPEKALHDALLELNQDLHDSFINDELSGTTACVVLLHNNELIVSNVGDSRAVIVRELEDGSLVTEDLSRDQTPFRDDECERVKSYGARVLTLDQIEGIKDPNVKCWTVESECDGDPPRLWAPDAFYPGTAFTRSIGDSIAERIGVVADSETSRITLKTGDKYLIVATDGIWEFISSHEAATMVAKYQNPMEAAEALAAEAYRLWLQYERRTDDISIAIVSFEG